MIFALPDVDMGYSRAFHSAGNFFFWGQICPHSLNWAPPRPFVQSRLLTYPDTARLMCGISLFAPLSQAFGVGRRCR